MIKEGKWRCRHLIFSISRQFPISITPALDQTIELIIIDHKPFYVWEGIRMKKFLAVFLIVFCTTACGQFQSSQQLGMQTAVASTATSFASTAISYQGTASALAISATDAAWTAVPTATTAIDYTALIGINGAQLYTGPSENYDSKFLFTDKVTIVGQANNCAWFKVISNADSSMVGWISADKITYTVQCSDVQAADYPPPPLPTATSTLFPTATTKPAGNVVPPSQNSCKPESAMVIGNRTGATATFTLKGPGTFYVTLPPDKNTTFAVCEGCYDLYFTSSGCGGGGGYAGKICDGFNGWIYCK
jgi:hypothetical protein